MCNSICDAEVGDLIFVSYMSEINYAEKFIVETRAISVA